MKGIIAVNNLNIIGVNSFLPWKSSEDMKHFRNLTMGGNILVGYNTSILLPMLDERKIFIYLRKPYKKYDINGNETPHLYLTDFKINEDRYSNFVNDETIENVKIDWCIGGKKTFEKYCNRFTELHISHINDNTEGDVTYPDFKNLNPNCKIFHYYFEVDK